MTVLDAWALGAFLALYAGYHLLYVLLPRHFGLVTRESRMAGIREAWYRDLLRARQPILAIQAVRNMVMSHTYFGTVALLVLGGVFSYLVAHIDLPQVLAEDGYRALASTHPLVMKLLVALAVLLVAVLNFSMGIRVCFNLNFALGGPADAEGDVSFPMEMLQRQARHFILGVRSLYFSGPVFLWLLHPALLVAGSVLIVALLARFDFLKGLRDGPAPGT